MPSTSELLQKLIECVKRGDVLTAKDLSSSVAKWRYKVPSKIFARIQSLVDMFVQDSKSVGHVVVQLTQLNKEHNLRPAKLLNKKKTSNKPKLYKSGPKVKRATSQIEPEPTPLPVSFLKLFGYI